MGTVTSKLMDRPLYTTAHAANLLRMPTSTLRYWLQGRSHGAQTYLPVLRDSINDDDTVRWGELIEAAVLRHLRTKRKSQMRELRLCRLELLRRYPEHPYPFANDSLYFNRGRLVLEDLRGFWEPATGLALNEEAVKLFVDEVRWQDHVAVSWRPSPEFPNVILEPERRFGMPQVAGVRTQSIFDLIEAGERLEDVASDLDLSPDLAAEAVAYERERRGQLRAA